MKDKSLDAISKEISEAEQKMNELGDRVRRLWNHICIHPVKWIQDQYPGEGNFWVIAVMGYRCLYFNPVEGGWGWGRFKEYGVVSEYHWQDEEIQDSVYKAMFTIDYGGNI